MVYGPARRISGEAQASGCVGLGVAIHDQSPHVASGKSGPQVDGSGCLSDTALLIGNCNDSSQSFQPQESQGKSIKGREVMQAKRALCFTWNTTDLTSLPASPRSPQMTSSKRFLPPPNFPLPAAGQTDSPHLFDPAVNVGQSTSLLVAEPEEDPSPGFQAAPGKWHKFLQMPHRSCRCLVINRRWLAASKIFQAFPAHFNEIHSTNSGHLFEERPLLGDRFQKCHRQVREDNLQAQAGKPRPASDVQ